MQFVNRPDTSSELSTIFNFLNQVRAQRQDAAQITDSLTLAKSIDIESDEFVQELAYLPLGQDTLNAILGSRPNFNYLYSNFSRTYFEPVTLFVQTASTQTLINFLYGPDLDVCLFFPIYYNLNKKPIMDTINL